MSGGRLRARLPDLALEAAMVVFAVLVALAVDEWREQRQYHDLADRARAAVVSEVRANLSELERTRDGLARLRADILATVDSIDAGRDAALDLTIELPEFSTAAWQAAQVTQAAPYLDYGWVIRVARAYDGNRIYEQVRNQLLEALGGMASLSSERETLALIASRLGILIQLHQSMEERYRAIAEEG